MADDEEPPALSSSRPGPPAAAFSSGGPPPASVFASSRAASSSSAASGGTDLNSRWKQYESERGSSSKKTTMVGPDGPAHSDYDLYETPEKLSRKSSPSANIPRQLYSGSDSNMSEGLEIRRSHSLTKSNSYDTSALIAKYAGVSGVPSTSNTGIQRNLSNTTGGSSSAIPSSARAEAFKVLAMADEQISTNQPFEVSRTQSGGFRATAVSEPESAFSFQRSKSGSRRTPSALSGLGFGSGKNNSTTEWKSNRYAFTDPKFRDDDYLPEEEDEIVSPVKRSSNSYRDDPNGGVFDNVAFDGDYPSPRKGSSPSWSSRYSDNPSVSPSSILDRYDMSHMKAEPQSGRKGARNMFMSTASSVRNNVRAFVEEKVNSRSPETESRVFGKGFSFKSNKKNSSPSRKGGASATGSTNLRTVWKDDTFNDEDVSDDHKQHKTWEQVTIQKKRRRRILISILCVVVVATVVGVSLSQTAWRWKFKNLWGNGNAHLDVTFYATSNTPIGLGITEARLKQDLANIPSDAEFVAHLGNLQDTSLGMCPASRMGEAASLLHGQAPIPIFVVPGEHDWVNCPNQMSAFARWLAAFATDKAMEKPNSLIPGGTAGAASAGDFDRPKSTPEIFSKLHHGVLFFGLHLVSGTVTDGQGMEMQTIRDEKMAMFVRGTLDRLQGDFRAVVLLGNARPGPRQHNFFDSIREDLTNARVPTAYVHSHSGVGETVHYPFGTEKSRGDVLEGMMAIQAANGASGDAPLKITVGFGKNPFTIG